MIRLPHLVIGYTRVCSCRGGSGIPNARTGTPTSLEKKFNAENRPKVTDHRTS